MQAPETRVEPIEFPVEGLVDDQIRLRLAADSDRPAFVAACQDREIQRFTTVPHPYDEENAREFAEHAARGFAAGSEVTAVVADRSSDELLGTIALRRRATNPRRWSVGYWVAPWGRGRGVAARAVGLVARFGFDQLGATRIELCAEPENRGSVAVAERAGFQREGLLRAYMSVNGESRDVFMYSLLPGDLP